MNREETHQQTFLISCGKNRSASHTLVLFVLGGFFFIALLSLTLSGRAAVLVLDKPSQHFVYPLTIQNLMHIMFFIGLGEVFVRWRIASREKNFLRQQFLPEDDQTESEQRNRQAFPSPTP